MTVPSVSGWPDGASGRTNDTNFWPNSVVGRISTETFDGIFSAAEGSRAMWISACSPSWVTSRT